MLSRDRFVVRKDEDYEGWIEARRHGVTATQVANASTPAGFEKAAADFLVEWREPDNPYMKFGRDWESHIADFVEVEFGVAPNEWLIRGQNPRHLATPDGLSADHRGLANIRPLARIGRPSRNCLCVTVARFSGSYMLRVLRSVWWRGLSVRKWMASSCRHHLVPKWDSSNVMRR